MLFALLTTRIHLNLKLPISFISLITEINLGTEKPAAASHTSMLLVYRAPHGGKFSIWKPTRNGNIATCCTSPQRLTVLNAGIFYLKNVKEMNRPGLNSVRLNLWSSICWFISQSHSTRLISCSHINPIFMALERSARNTLPHFHGNFTALLFELLSF